MGTIFSFIKTCSARDRSSRQEVFLGKDVLKICSQFTGKHPCRSVISIKLQSTLKNTSGQRFLPLVYYAII